MSFLQLVASGEVGEAYRRYIGSGFCNHNPYFRGDADSLIHGMEENAVKNPNRFLEVKRVIEEGDIVVVHSHVKQRQDDPGIAVTCAFKV